MQVSEGLAVVEPVGFGHEVFDQGQDPIGAVNEGRQGVAPIRRSVRATLIEPGFGACGIVGRRQPDECEVMAALEVSALLLELRAALGVDQAGGWIRKLAIRIAVGGVTLGLDEDRPA